MPTTYCLTRSEYVAVREHSPDALMVEVEYAPQGAHPPSHFHPAQDEHFKVIFGALRAAVNAKVHTRHAGDVLDVPRGALHPLWDPSDMPPHATWSTRPAGWIRPIVSAPRGRAAQGRSPSPCCSRPTATPSGSHTGPGSW